MRRMLAVAVMVFLVVSSAKVSGQSSTSVSAGPTLLFGPASEWAGRGYHLQLGEEFGHLRSGVFRVDALYSQRPGNGLTRSPVTERTFAVAASAIFRGPSMGLLRPYALTGVGLYGDNSWTSYAPGVNAGLGAEATVGHAHFFFESRVHQYWRDARNSPPLGRGVTLAPLSIGIRF